MRHLTSSPAALLLHGRSEACWPHPLSDPHPRGRYLDASNLGDKEKNAKKEEMTEEEADALWVPPLLRQHYKARCALGGISFLGGVSFVSPRCDPFRFRYSEQTWLSPEMDTALDRLKTRVARLAMLPERVSRQSEQLQVVK